MAAMVTRFVMPLQRLSLSAQKMKYVHIHACSGICSEIIFNLHIIWLLNATIAHQNAHLLWSALPLTAHILITILVRSQNSLSNINECANSRFIIIQWLKSVSGRWISASESIILSFSCHDDVRARVWRAPPSLSPSLWLCHRPPSLSLRTPPKLNKLRGSLRCVGGI